jgi:hypothetical protein
VGLYRKTHPPLTPPASGRGTPHHFPPASSIALSNARLLAVRFWPALRGSSGMPSSARRAARRAPSSAMRMTGSPASAFEVFDAIIAHAFFANSPLKIVAIDAGVKGEEQASVLAPVGRGAGSILAHAIGDHWISGRRDPAERSSLNGPTHSVGRRI